MCVKDGIVGMYSVNESTASIHWNRRFAGTAGGPAQSAAPSSHCDTISYTFSSRKILWMHWPFLAGVSVLGGAFLLALVRIQGGYGGMVGGVEGLNGADVERMARHGVLAVIREWEETHLALYGREVSSAHLSKHSQYKDSKHLHKNDSANRIPAFTVAPTPGSFFTAAWLQPARQSALFCRACARVSAWLVDAAQRSEARVIVRHGAVFLCLRLAQLRKPIVSRLVLEWSAGSRVG